MAGSQPPLPFHFTPTPASWLTLVEIWLGSSDTKAIHRGIFRSVSELGTAMRTFIRQWPKRASHPFLWTKPAGEVPNSINQEGSPVSTTSH